MDHSPLTVVQFFGGIFLLMGLAVGTRGLWRWRSWTHATGKVVDYVAAAGSEYDDYYPKIRVTNQRGGPVEFVSAIGGTGKPWKIGARVPVLFRRSGDGVEGEVVSRFFLWVFPGLCLVVGGLLLCAKDS